MEEKNERTYEMLSKRTEEEIFSVCKNKCKFYGTKYCEYCNFKVDRACFYED